jgi:hypothetical protein
MNTLLVMAAGLGKRYGDLKQMDAMGPHGETVLDYSVFDAMQAGFGRVVFVIRAEFEEAFKARIGSRYANRIHVAYVRQDLHDVPTGFSIPPGRTKPWGTLHAVLAARDVLDGPFAVVNADDFYGREAFFSIAHFFTAIEGKRAIPGEPDHYCMMGYKVRNTLSGNGGVNRGICMEKDGFLITAEEHTDIRLDGDGVCRGNNLAGKRVPVSLEAVSSMNIWGFTPAVLAQMAQHFEAFLRGNGTSLSAECYIPSVVDSLIRNRLADCCILPTASHWFGVTYPQDKAICVNNIQKLIAAGVYKADLWS